LNWFIFEQVKINEIVAHCSTVNTGCWKVMEKLACYEKANLN
jgi:RimJ/RimL family protein N-acetyltransferase